jgi:hypothetical protein
MNLSISSGEACDDKVESCANVEFDFMTNDESFSRGVEEIIAESCEVSAQSVQSIQPVVPVKKLEVGAGALIEQEIYVDPKNMDYWETSPVGMVYINYCDKETLKQILQKGRREEKSNGFMEGLKVGS